VVSCSSGNEVRVKAAEGSALGERFAKAMPLGGNSFLTNA
jgi:hypothetical protein